LDELRHNENHLTLILSLLIGALLSADDFECGAMDCDTLVHTASETAAN